MPSSRAPTPHLRTTGCSRSPVAAYRNRHRAVYRFQVIWKRVAAAAVVVAFVSVLTWAVLPRPASADSLHVDWWTRDHSVTAPSGGFAVADDVDGAVAVSAVRIRLDQGVTSAVLVAPPAHVDTGTTIVACPAATGWSDAQGADLAGAPKADCARASAPFTASGDH